MTLSEIQEVEARIQAKALAVRVHPSIWPMTGSSGTVNYRCAHCLKDFPRVMKPGVNVNRRRVFCSDVCGRRYHAAQAKLRRRK